MNNYIFNETNISYDIQFIETNRIMIDILIKNLTETDNILGINKEQLTKFLPLYINLMNVKENLIIAKNSFLDLYEEAINKFEKKENENDGI